MWRYTALPVKVAILDARACIPVLVFVLYWSWTTAYIAIVGVVFFTVISWFGLTVPCRRAGDPARACGWHPASCAGVEAAAPRMSNGVELGLVSRTLQRLLEQGDRSILYDCRASRRTLSYAADSAAAPTGLLPAFLSAADAVWREATGKSLGVEIVTHPNTVLGYTVVCIHGGTFATVMLAVMEAIEQVAQPRTLLVNDLGRVWQDAEDRIARAARVPVSA